MHDIQDFEVCYDMFRRALSRKNCLEPKFIELRKISQEKHVNRMKLAVEKRQQKASENNQDLFLLSFKSRNHKSRLSKTQCESDKAYESKHFKHGDKTKCHIKNVKSVVIDDKGKECQSNTDNAEFQDEMMDTKLNRRVFFQNKSLEDIQMRPNYQDIAKTGVKTEIRSDKTEAPAPYNKSLARNTENNPSKDKSSKGSNESLIPKFVEKRCKGLEQFCGYILSPPSKRKSHQCFGTEKSNTGKRNSASALDSLDDCNKITKENIPKSRASKNIVSKDLRHNFTKSCSLRENDKCTSVLNSKFKQGSPITTKIPKVSSNFNEERKAIFANKSLNPRVNVKVTEKQAKAEKYLRDKKRLEQRRQSLSELHPHPQQESDTLSSTSVKEQKPRGILSDIKAKGGAETSIGNLYTVSNVAVWLDAIDEPNFESNTKLKIKSDSKSETLTLKKGKETEIRNTGDGSSFTDPEIDSQAYNPEFWSADFCDIDKIKKQNISSSPNSEVYYEFNNNPLNCEGEVKKEGSIKSKDVRKSIGDQNNYSQCYSSKNSYFEYDLLNPLLGKKKTNGNSEISKDRSNNFQSKGKINFGYGTFPSASMSNLETQN